MKSTQLYALLVTSMAGLTVVVACHTTDDDATSAATDGASGGAGHGADGNADAGQDGAVTGQGGGGATGAGGAPSAATEDDFFTALARFYCEQELRSCCDEVGLAYDATCVSVNAKALRDGYAEAEAAGTVGPYDATVGAQCLATVAAVPAGCIFDPQSARDDVALPACDRPFKPVGTVAPGGACSKTVDCADDSSGFGACDAAPDGKGHACRVYVRARAGEPCGDDATHVRKCHRGDGLRCDAATKTCVSLAKTGDSCARSLDCVTGDYCGGDQHCASQLALHAACTRAASEDDPCGGAANYCDPTSNTCEHEPTDATCSAAHTCDGGAVCDSGVCDTDARKLSLLCGGMLGL